MAVAFCESYLSGFVKEKEYAEIFPLLQVAHGQLARGDGAGCDFLGWEGLPGVPDREEYARVKAAAARIREGCEVLVVIGIGGSYLGARSAIEFVKGHNYNLLEKPQIFFAGNTISGRALEELLTLCEGKSVMVNVISKSGTTTEPAIAFRVFKKWMEERYGKAGARERIFVTTDKSRGALKTLADAEGYETFVVPDDVGGRYSVLSPVGLLPIAAAGIDTDGMLAGASEAKKRYETLSLENPCCRYAMARNILLRRGKTTEILVAYEPRAQYFAEWWKQLFGESEGKDGKGLYPSSVLFSTDLHSMGQYIQDGMRNIFETVLSFGSGGSEITVPDDPGSADGLDFLAGTPLEEVNRAAMRGTLLSHTDGGVPNVVLEVPGFTAADYGDLVYFFERACALSGYIGGLNPFDQPGVEGYKKNMFALLGKPGFEERRAELLERLS